METLGEIGAAVALERRARGLKQSELAALVGLSPETLSRFEHGRLPEFGTRKLLALLGAMGIELRLVPRERTGSLDELRRERGGETVHAPND